MYNNRNSPYAAALDAVSRALRLRRKGEREERRFNMFTVRHLCGTNEVWLDGTTLLAEVAVRPEEERRGVPFTMHLLYGTSSVTFNNLLLRYGTPCGERVSTAVAENAGRKEHFFLLGDVPVPIRAAIRVHTEGDKTYFNYADPGMIEHSRTLAKLRASAWSSGDLKHMAVFAYDWLLTNEEPATDGLLPIRELAQIICDEVASRGPSLRRGTKPRPVGTFRREA